VFRLNPLTGFFGFFGARDLVSDHALRKLVGENLEVELLEETPVPLHVVATDLLSGRELRLSTGDAMEAVIASAAIPGVFPAVERNGRLLIDGGVADNRRSSRRSSSGRSVCTCCRPGTPAIFPSLRAARSRCSSTP
jgi:NTE family protein